MLKKIIRALMVGILIIGAHQPVLAGWYIYIDPDRYLPFGDETVSFRVGGPELTKQEIPDDKHQEHLNVKAQLDTLRTKLRAIEAISNQAEAKLWCMDSGRQDPALSLTTIGQCFCPNAADIEEEADLDGYLPGGCHIRVVQALVWVVAPISCLVFGSMDACFIPCHVHNFKLRTIRRQCRRDIDHVVEQIRPLNSQDRVFEDMIGPTINRLIKCECVMPGLYLVSESLSLNPAPWPDFSKTLDTLDFRTSRPGKTSSFTVKIPLTNMGTTSKLRGNKSDVACWGEDADRDFTASIIGRIRSKGLQPDIAHRSGTSRGSSMPGRASSRDDTFKEIVKEIAKDVAKDAAKEAATEGATRLMDLMF